MSTVELVRLDEKNSLSEIIKKLRNHISPEEFGALNMFHRTFVMTFAFLPEIWQRVLEDVKLDTKYWEVYAELYHPEAEKREPTPEESEIRNIWREHRFRLNLDVEDWFIHSHILMDKFAKFAKRLIEAISKTPEELKLAQNIPDRSFYKQRKFLLRSQNLTLLTDTIYADIIRENTSWYIKELKDIRDDLIQHEIVPRFWTYWVSKDKIQLSRFRHNPKLLEILYELRDKYKLAYPKIEGEKNFFTLFSFFEKHIDELEKKDGKRIEHVGKSYGARFPDIPTLFNKMSNFFSLVNDHFVAEIQRRFE